MKRPFAVGLLVSALACASYGFAVAADAPNDSKPNAAKVADAKTADAKPGDSKTAAAPGTSEAETLLKQKGLVRVDPFFVLAGEREVTQQMAGLDKLKRAAFDGQKMVNKAEQEEAGKKADVVAALEQRRALRAQLAKNPPVNVYNRIVAQINELGDRAILLEKQIEDSSPVKPAVAAAGKAREAYAEQLLQIRREMEKLQEKYADLAADPKVSAAIDDYNTAHNKKLKLGPTTTLATNDRKLKKFEETVLSDSIDITHVAGDLWQASVVFNGKPPQMLDIDTGASMVALSYKTAQAVGLTPSETDPTVQMQMADGHVVDAKKVVAKSIRIGKFEVEKVECVVMPANLPDAGSMIGQTFLRNFTYKIDPERSKLVMTRVETNPSAAAKKPKAAN